MKTFETYQGTINNVRLNVTEHIDEPCSIDILMSEEQQTDFVANMEGDLEWGDRDRFDDVLITLVKQHYGYDDGYEMIIFDGHSEGWSLAHGDDYYTVVNLEYDIL